MKAYMFPGQGSQTKGMGASLFDTVEEYRDMERHVDEIMGFSVREMCLENPDNALRKTENTQPCLYVVNALHYFAEVKNSGTADVLVGHSLGEYNALHAAGAFSFFDGLRLVRRRGQLMAKVTDGGMCAVMGIASHEIERVVQAEGSAVDVANYNSPMQTIISGPVLEIKRIAIALEKAGAKMCIPLEVSAAFHSRHMQSAADEFAQYLRHFSFKALSLPVIANVTARPYGDGNPSVTVKNLLIQQIPGSVKWMQSIRTLRDMGVGEFKEVGVGNVLTRLMAQMP